MSGLRGARARRRGVCLLLLAGVSGTLAGQIPTEEVASDRVLTPRESVDQEITASRYGLGPVRLTPGFYVADATYDNNVYGTPTNPTGDFRVTVAAGLGLLAPVTRNFFIRGTVLPSYTWYATLAERRFFGGRYGGSLLLFANRLTLQGGGEYSRTDVVYSTENQERVIQNLSEGGLGIEYRVLTRVYLYAGGRIQDFRYSNPGAPSTVPNPTTTNRTTYLVRAEVRYKWGESATFGAGVEETKAEFVYSPQLYDNRTRAVIGSLNWDRPNYFVHFLGGYREGDPIHGSTIPPFAGFTGGGSASYSLFRWLQVNALGGRTLSYGTSSPYYIVTRYGGGLTLSIGWRLQLRGFADTGQDSYTTLTSLPDGSSVYRKDDVTNYGGGLQVLMTPRLRLNGAVTESRYNSNVPGNTRSYFRWSVTLGFGGNLLQ